MVADPYVEMVLAGPAVRLRMQMMLYFQFRCSRKLDLIIATSVLCCSSSFFPTSPFFTSSQSSFVYTEHTRKQD